ncbi:copper fist DNA binding domain-containing protein [Aspergillus carlsbadensis]|nr:copper fist DNA binding domain-containing protein [Aspergillus carlsbadensis]
MPLDEQGNKWSCEPCLRGHRSSKCKHFDRVMVKVPKSGRPLKQCPHGRSQYCRCRRSYAIMTSLSSESQNLCRPLYHVEGHYESHPSSGPVENPASSFNLTTSIASLNDAINPPVSTTEHLPPPHDILPTQLPRLAPWPLPLVLHAQIAPECTGMSPGTGFEALESHLRIGEHAAPERPYSITPPAINNPWSPPPPVLEEPFNIPHDSSLAANQPVFDLLDIGIPFSLDAHMHALPRTETRSTI